MKAYKVATRLPQTMAEKIMSNYSGKKVKAGDYVEAQPDWIVFCDMQWHHSIQRGLEEVAPDELWNPERVVVVPDHRIPANNPFHANVQVTMRDFVAKYGVEHFYDVGRGGIRNQVLLEEGFFVPGGLVLSDEPNITSTGGMVGCLGFGESAAIVEALCLGETWFKVPATMVIELNGVLAPGVQTRDVALFLSRQLGQQAANDMVVEFRGNLLESLSLDELNTLVQQTPLTLGAVSSLVSPTARVLEYLQNRMRTQPVIVESDSDAPIAVRHVFDVSSLEPQISAPPESSTAVPVTEFLGMKLHQAYIGSCSSARIEDLRIAAELLRGHKVHSETRLLINPISHHVMRQAVDEGLVSVFLEAGAEVVASSCGACPGGHAGVLGDGEICLTTTSHNYPGRMGSDTAKIYIASPATVVASAIHGQVTDPRSVWRSHKHAGAPLSS